MKAFDNQSVLPPPIVVSGREDLDSLLSKEWLLPNKLGSYASSTAAGCNVRRYHGLLAAAMLPPVGRIMALSTVMEQLACADVTYYLATNEFSGTFSPMGAVHLVEFRNDVAPTFVFRAGEIRLIKEIILAESANAVAIRYTLHGPAATLSLWPFTPLRDFHQLRRVHEPHQMTFQSVEGGAVVQDRMQGDYTLHLIGREAQFQPKPQWWYRSQYRIDVQRGQDGFEDLYTPGCFIYKLEDGQTCQFNASLNEPADVDFEATLSRRRSRLIELAASVGPDADETTRRLALATDAFVVQRSFPDAAPSATILAGYHWFADWGRDAFLALSGLLLCTRRFEEARQVFRTFASHLANGMIPNRFDDYSTTAHYNSLDASLWFIIAADRYVQATDDTEFWHRTLKPVANAILTAYHNGTDFDIHADTDGLLTGGSYKTQLTWMDAALGEEAITPRHGKAVEVNALWHCAHRVMAERCRGMDDSLADQYTRRAEAIGQAFAGTFWNAQSSCLYDCIVPEGPDGSIRPNQIFAVSLPHCPLPSQQQHSIVRVVSAKLLTPLGLRTLSPDDSRYRRRCGGSWESRDRAYHQGTVWAYLIGPFIEAYLKVEGNKPFALEMARTMLRPFDAHLHEGGLGYISEIFDGDPPHQPRGCIAQAWSVAEVLRAKQLVNQLSQKAP